MKITEVGNTTKTKTKTIPVYNKMLQYVHGY